MLPNQRFNQRLLVGKILVERAYAYAGTLSDQARRGTFVAMRNQNLSGGRQNCLNGSAGPFLNRTFSWSYKDLVA
jgi:hypothetical protein